MDITIFLLKYKFVIAFYLIIILLIYFYRNKFEIQGKIIYLYKTKIGLKFMDIYSQPLSKKFDVFGSWLFNISSIITGIAAVLLIVNKFFNFLNETTSIFVIVFSAFFLIMFLSIVIFRQFRKAGVVGIYIGFIGMVVITIFVLKGFLDLFLKPNAPAVLSPVIPGVSIPGSPITVPFWYGIIALFVVVLIHEFSHGLLCKTHNIKVKSSGVGMMAILPLAFVEPDENSLKKASSVAQHSMFAAGPFSNILTGIIFLLMMVFIFMPMTFSLTEPINGGVMLFSVNGTPARDAGIGYENNLLIPADVLTSYTIADKPSLRGDSSGAYITHFNGVPINDTDSFMKVYKNISIGKEVTFSNSNKEYHVIPTNRSGSPYLGVNIINLQLKENASKTQFSIYIIILEFLVWLNALSFGLGLANLLPLGITDGGRMIHLWLTNKFGKKSESLFLRLTGLFVVIVIITVLLPILRAIF